MMAEQQPFIGPRPFTSDYRDRFFGRRRETADLVSLVISHPIVFLYGRSGTGKTSLLHAGLIPLLAEQEGFDVFPVVRPGGRVDVMGAEQTTASPYVYATLLTWSGGLDSAEPLRHTSLTDYLASRPPRLDAVDEPAPRLLIFDQVEELFRDQIDAAQEQHEFFAQIGELLDASRFRVSSRGAVLPGALIPTRVLLAMREEYIAELDTFAAHLPDKLRIRLRLERLREPAALEAVTGPLALTPLAFAPGAPEQLVRDLREVRVEAGFGEERTAVNVLGEFVEPVQLQVVCERLVRDLPPGVTEITTEHLSQFGSVDATLTAFYQEAVAFAASAAGVSQETLERWCESFLITGTGTRAVVHRGPTDSAGMPNAAPDALVSRFLLRVEQRAGAFWYELTHDRLIGPIQAARNTRAERERLDEERREADMVHRRRQAQHRARMLASSVAAICIFGIIIGLWWLRGERLVCDGTLTCAWRFQTGASIFGRPAVNAQRVFVPSTDAQVYALDSADPKPIWTVIQAAASRRELWAPFQAGAQIWSSPALAGGLLYFGSEDQRLYAVDAATGVERWREETGGPIVTSPAVAAGVVYVGSYDQHVYAFDAVSGEERWRFRTRGQLISSPIVVNGLVYFGSDDYSIYAVDASSGVARWTVPTEGEVRSTPVIHGGLLFVGSHDGRVYALDTTTGEEEWRFDTGAAVRSSPAVVDGRVFVGSYDGNVYAIDAATGDEVWRFPTGDLVVSSPLVTGGVVYVGSDDRRFYAIDAASGTLVGLMEVGSVVQSFPAEDGDLVLFGAGDGSLYAVNKAPSGGSLAVPAGTPDAASSATPDTGMPAGATPVT